MPEVLNTARGRRPRAVLRPRDLKVSGKFCLSLQPVCVEEGRVSVDVQSARSIANQNKTLQHDF